jgi:hypothetical protein
MAKSNSIITHTVTPDGIVFTIAGAGSFTFDPRGCTDDVELSATTHGYVQKISDRAAIGRDPDTGKSASPAEKLAAMHECADRLQSGGPWNAVREGGGNEGGLLYRAMKALFPASWGSREEFADCLQRTAEERKIEVSDVRRSLMAVKSVREKMNELREPGDSALGDAILDGLK